MGDNGRPPSSTSQNLRPGKKFSFSNLSIKSGDANRASINSNKPLPRPPSQRSPAESDTTQGNTIAQLYAVFGLPKDPAVWTLAEEDCTNGVHHIESAVGRFWRPEVLGCTVCPPVAQIAAESTSPLPHSNVSFKTQARASGWGSDKKGSNPKYVEMSDGHGGIQRVETARVLSKALKLSFTREIEITSGPGNFPPSSTCHNFTFSVSVAQDRPDVLASGPTYDQHSRSPLAGNSYGSASRSNGHDHDGVEDITFYGSVLTVWSAADEKRTKAVKKELDRLAKARAADRNASKAVNGANSVDEDFSEGASAFGHSLLPDNNAFFMPYAICIISRYPIYNLLGDWNKSAWFKYSRNIEMHNKLMAAILHYPAPRIGETFTLPSPDEEMGFVCTFPGAVDWSRGSLGIDFSMWPLFKVLSVEHILTVCEIAMSPAGRVLFMSRHPALMSMAVETVKYLVELCGWKGMVHHNCHARDIRIYLEDPGTWLIAINTELRSIIKPPKEVCVVDLDINFINCPRPPLKAISKGSVRDRKRRKVMATLGFNSYDYSVPREYVDAFPGGRFHPLSKVEARSGELPYELMSPPKWWNQSATLAAFDQVLHEASRPNVVKKLLNMNKSKQIRASETEIAAICALRKRATNFVDARDGLENKIGRLNKRLAFLMSEGEMWRQQFDKIQQLVDRLTREAGDLRGKLDKERRESRRLTSTLHQKDMDHVQVQLQLRETEQAREKAQTELLRMREAMDTLETEREAMVDEIRNVLSSSGSGEVEFSTFNHLHPMSHRFAFSDAAASPAGSDLSHNTEAHVMKARALAEQRISMGPVRTNSHLKEASRAPSAQHENGTAGASTVSGSTHNHFPDEQMNTEIQNRTTAVTDQIARIQQQLESTLSNLEGRRSATFERRDRRRLSSSSIASSYRYENQGPPSSLGHYAASSMGHGHMVDSNDDRNDAQHEAVETMDGDSSLKNGAFDRARRRISTSTPTRQNVIGRATPTFSPNNSSRALTDSVTSREANDKGVGADTDSSALRTAGSAAAVVADSSRATATTATGPDSTQGSPVVESDKNPRQEEAGESDLSQKLDELEREMSNQGADADDDSGGMNMFDEPADFRPKTPPATVTHYEFPGTSSKVELNLVGAHPLWGHLAWNASFIIADFLCAHALTLTKGKKVLELGAAAGLPSIVCNWASASHVVATDYPDTDLISNLTKNVALNCQDESCQMKGPGKTFVEGYVWGRDPSPLLAHLSNDSGQPGKFDLILLSDLVFNHQAHPALLETCETCLSTEVAPADEDGSITTPCVLVFFTHHRPHLAYKDMQFFDMAEVKGWKFEKLGEWYRDPMFPEDAGDEVVRSTIHGYRLWRA